MANSKYEELLDILGNAARKINNPDALSDEQRNTLRDEMSLCSEEVNKCADVVFSNHYLEGEVVAIEENEVLGHLHKKRRLIDAIYVQSGEPRDVLMNKFNVLQASKDLNSLSDEIKITHKDCHIPAPYDGSNKRFIWSFRNPIFPRDLDEIVDSTILPCVLALADIDPSVYCRFSFLSSASPVRRPTAFDAGMWGLVNYWEPGGATSPRPECSEHVGLPEVLLESMNFNEVVSFTWN